MSQENVELVKKALAALNRGDLDGFLGVMTHDVVIDLSGRMIDPVTATGQEEVRTLSAMYEEIWSDQRVEAEDWIDAGDALVVPIRMIRTGRASGAPVEARAAWVVYVRDGKVSLLDTYQSRAEALEAVGLSE